jgi:hypothetical protein
MTYPQPNPNADDVVKNLTKTDADVNFSLRAWGWHELGELYGALDVKPPSWAKYAMTKETLDTAEERALVLLRAQQAKRVGQCMSSMSKSSARVLKIEYVLCPFDTPTGRAKFHKSPVSEYLYELERAKVEMEKLL